MSSSFTVAGIEVATEEPEACGFVAAVASAFAGFEARPAAEARMVTARAAYWTAEDAANVVNPSLEVLAAWAEARVAFDAALAAVRC